MAGFGAGPAPEGPIKAQTLPLLSEPEMLERICFLLSGRKLVLDGFIRFHRSGTWGPACLDTSSCHEIACPRGSWPMCPCPASCPSAQSWRHLASSQLWGFQTYEHTLGILPDLKPFCWLGGDRSPGTSHQQNQLNLRDAEVPREG